jgi:hypothetical protein
MSLANEFKHKPPDKSLNYLKVVRIGKQDQINKLESFDKYSDTFRERSKLTLTLGRVQSPYRNKMNEGQL